MQRHWFWFIEDSVLVFRNCVFIGFGLVILNLGAHCKGSSLLKGGYNDSSCNRSFKRTLNYPCFLMTTIEYRMLASYPSPTSSVMFQLPECGGVRTTGNLR